MAAEAALANRHIVSTILFHLSDMKYKDRRQYGPDEPVEFLEFRPTLVPAILVNRTWADEGTSILWRRYPHLPTFQHMVPERRQYYANKVQRVFLLSPPPGHAEGLDYLDGLAWPNLKSLELEVDLQRFGSSFEAMLYDGLEHLELSGYQSGGSKYFVETILPRVFNACKNLKRIRIGSDIIADEDPVHVSALYDPLDASPTVETVEIKSANLVDKDALFARLSQRSHLVGLEIDLDPGVALLPLLSGPNKLPSPFASLTRAWIMCYPEVALALPVHLRAIKELQLDIARIPSSYSQPTDFSIFDEILVELSHCPELRLLKIGVGLLAVNFPSSTSLPYLSGSALVRLAETCPKLEDISLQATEPSAIDASSISSADFERFCESLPDLRSLNLKLQPTTASALQTTALQALGRYCADLEILRLKVPFQLPVLPVPNTAPQSLASSGSIPRSPAPGDKSLTSNIEASADPEADKPGSSNGLPKTRSLSPHVSPLFPRLTHLAISRPETALAAVVDSFSYSSSAHSESEVVDPNLEEDLVHSWAHPLLTHFPRLEILEAWGDWTGEDNELLNYFLPTQEILASTWGFLSGVEQDLWEEEEEPFDEGDSWDSLEDWEKASLMNEFIVEEQDMPHDLGKLSLYDEEPEGMITPGRILEADELFEASQDDHDSSRP